MDSSGNTNPTQSGAGRSSGGLGRLGAGRLREALRKNSLAVLILTFFCFFALPPNATAQLTAGNISGTVKDPSGGVVPAASVTVRNVGTGHQQTTQTNSDGFYAFPSLAVGQYELDVASRGFESYKRTGILIDVNTKLLADVALQMGNQTENVTVSANTVQVETASSQMGDVITGQTITAVGLNGRSYTDLLALQPGIVPMSTQTPDSVVMAGVTVAIPPSGNLNPGNQSISGQREDANGFLVNGSDVKEEMNGGSSIIPNLDSISEFRVLTNNFDAELGNYSGGIVNVVTKSGGDELHGNAFEFLRNTDLDARSYFSPDRDTYQQNQFGGTLGGPDKKEQAALLFWGLSGDPDDRRPGYRADYRTVTRGPHWQSRRHGQLILHSKRTFDRNRRGFGGAASEFAGLSSFQWRAVLHAGMLKFHVRIPERRHSEDGLDSSFQKPIAVHPATQPGPDHIRRFRRREDSRRQTGFSHRQECRALGESLGVLLFRRLSLNQSISQRPGRCDRSRIRRCEPWPRTTH